MFICDIYVIHGLGAAVHVGKTVPEVLSVARGFWPAEMFQKKGINNPSLSDVK